MITRTQTKSNDDTDPKFHPEQTTNNSEEKSSSSTKTFFDNKSDTIDKNGLIDANEKSSLLDLLHHHIESFHGYGNARQWFINVNAEQTNKSLSSHSPIVINENQTGNSINCLNDKPTSIACQDTYQLIDKIWSFN